VPIWLGTIAVLAALFIVDGLIGQLFMTRNREFRVVSVAGNIRAQRRWIVLKGFSNPLEPFIEGMEAVTDGPMLVVHYGLCPEAYLLFDAILEGLRTLDGPREIAIYGHSRGGHIGRAFLKWYEASGSPHGPINELFLDCTPGNPDSLPAPTWVRAAMRGFLKVYKGGPILALIVALGNLYSRRKMPAPLDNTANKALYKRYARGLMWYNNRSWVLEMLSMLNERLPNSPQLTNARVIYIAAKDPSRDKLVKQTVAIEQWPIVFPGMTIRAEENVGHAWPLEQPATYRRIFDEELMSDR